MSASRVNPVDQVSPTATKGPQLVPRKADPTQVPQETVERADSHSLFTVLVVGFIAATGALLVAGSLWTWLVVRTTGVNWMFPG